MLVLCQASERPPICTFGGLLLTQSEQNQCRKCSTALFCSKTILRLLGVEVKFPQSVRLVAGHPIVEERNFHLSLGVLYFPAVSSGSVTARRECCGVEFVYSVDDGVGGVDDSGGLFEFDRKLVVVASALWLLVAVVTTV